MLYRRAILAVLVGVLLVTPAVVRGDDMEPLRGKRSNFGQ